MSVYYKLKLQELIYLISLLVAGYVFTVTQKYYIPEIIRPLTLIIAFVAVFALFYVITKPKDAKRLSNYLGLLIFIIALIVIIIQHVIIHFDITYKAGVILTASYLAPKLSYCIYSAIKKDI